jgi:predicted porin
MKKKIIVAAVAAAMVAPLAAMADATVYGKIRVGTVYHDRSDGAADSWELEDESSRLGIKGSEDLGGGLKAVYKMEFGTRVGDALGTISGRNAYVGLAGDWGTALWGRHDTPHKISTGPLDLFGDTTADVDQGGTHVGLFQDLRAQDAIAYISPSLSGLTLAGALVQTAATDDLSNAYSIAGIYSNGPWYASLSYEVLENDLLGAADDDTKWRVGLGVLGMSGFSATVIYEDHSDIGGVSGVDSQAWSVQGAYDFGNNRVKAMYGNYDDDSALDVADFDAWAIGFQHNFSKRTDAQIIYRAKDADNAGDDNTFSLQLNHNF